MRGAELDASNREWIDQLAIKAYQHTRGVFAALPRRSLTPPFPEWCPSSDMERRGEDALFPTIAAVIDGARGLVSNQDAEWLRSMEVLRRDPLKVIGVLAPSSLDCMRAEIILDASRRPFQAYKTYNVTDEARGTIGDRAIQGWTFSLHFTRGIASNDPALPERVLKELGEMSRTNADRQGGFGVPSFASGVMAASMNPESHFQPNEQLRSSAQGDEARDLFTGWVGGLPDGEFCVKTRKELGVEERFKEAPPIGCVLAVGEDLDALAKRGQRVGLQDYSLQLTPNGLTDAAYQGWLMVRDAQPQDFPNTIAPSVVTKQDKLRELIRDLKGRLGVIRVDGAYFACDTALRDQASRISDWKSIRSNSSPGWRREPTNIGNLIQAIGEVQTFPQIRTDLHQKVEDERIAVVRMDTFSNPTIFGTQSMAKYIIQDVK